MIIRKAIIPAAGLGTRLLPFSKEIPKEMLPLFDKKYRVSFKPLIQIIFERLYDIGIREFYIITGRGKRTIENHFSRDDGYLLLLKSIGKSDSLEDLLNLYNIVESSNVIWINQPKPTGLGAAILLVEPFIKNEPFIVYAGDTYISCNEYIGEMIEIFEKIKSSVLFLTAKVDSPQNYGIIEDYQIENERLYRVYKVIEKPKKTKSKLAIVPIYIFTPKIFEALKIVKPNNLEIQLTDSIQVIADNEPVYALELRNAEDYIDIGIPENYLKALKRSYRLSMK